MTKFKYVYEDVDRHGNVRTYFWRGKGHPKIRFRARRDTPEFHAAYAAALAGDASPTQPKQPNLKRPANGTLRWLCVEYMKSSTFQQLDARTQRVRRSIYESIFAEPIAPGAVDTFADFPLPRLASKAVRIVRDRKAAHPEAANGRVKALRRVFAWAIEEDLVANNPARDVAFLKGPPGGHHSWTVEEVRQYEKRHPVGTRARLAFALLLYTGQRRSDVVLFGRQHLREGWLSFTQQKNRHRKPVTLQLPVLPVLQGVIDRSPTGDLTFLVTEFGRPFTANGFGNKMRQWCDEAGLPHCSAHGLRKAGAAIAAENGATPHQLMSIFGWLTLKQAELYTRAARQKKMAAEAMQFLVRGPSENETFPLFDQNAGGGEN
jgi:integrase